MRTLDSIVNAKLANRAGATAIKIEDAINHAGMIRCSRKDYKRSVRHGRRALNLNLRRGVFNG